jgi:hypothetical protein
MEAMAMADKAQVSGGREGVPWRMLGWESAVALLVLPFVAMQFTREVNWTVGDFVFAALLIGAVGLAFELTVRASRNPTFRGGVAAALAASFLTIWANGAVGMIGDEGNPYNLLFLGVIGVGLIGSIIGRFRPPGMAVAMVVAAIAQAGVGLGGIAADVRGGILSTGFAGLWLISAALFRNAGPDQRQPAAR